MKMKNLKELRRIRNLSQSDLAKEIGVSTNTISHYEGGKTTPSEKVIEKICERYSVSRDWLMGNQTKKKNTAIVPAAPQVEEAEKAIPSERDVEICIQSVMGGSITTEEILARVYAKTTDVTHIYVKPEDNKAYYVGKKSRGFVVLWE